MPRLSFVGYVSGRAIEGRHNLLLLVTRPIRPPLSLKGKGVLHAQYLRAGFCCTYPLLSGQNLVAKDQRVAENPDAADGAGLLGKSIKQERICPQCHSAPMSLKKAGRDAIPRRCKFQTKHDREKEPWEIS